jgi:hypothetical protein
MLPPADNEMTVGRRRGSVAILDLARSVSCDAQTPLSGVPTVGVGNGGS